MLLAVWSLQSRRGAQKNVPFWRARRIKGKQMRRRKGGAGKLFESEWSRKASGELTSLLRPQGYWSQCRGAGEEPGWQPQGRAVDGRA